MIKIRTKVLRDGKIEEIDSENIVVGDIIELESGNKVPADLRLIDVKNLSIDESVLTGESKPKNKLDITLPKETELAERDNIAKVKRAWLSDYQTEKDAFRCDFE